MSLLCLPTSKESNRESLQTFSKFIYFFIYLKKKKKCKKVYSSSRNNKYTIFFFFYEHNAQFTKIAVATECSTSYTVLFDRMHSTHLLQSYNCY